MQDIIDYSIIMPAYNNERTISRCIDAVRNSKFSKKFEIFIVDDASQDMIARIAEKLGVNVIKIFTTKVLREHEILGQDMRKAQYLFLLMLIF